MRIVILFLTLISVGDCVFVTENHIAISKNYLLSEAYKIPGKKARSKIECTLACQIKHFANALMTNDLHCFCTHKSRSILEAGIRNLSLQKDQANFVEKVSSFKFLGDGLINLRPRPLQIC